MTTKEVFIAEIQESLLKKMDRIREDQNISVDEKLIKVDILLDLFKVLQSYDRNMEILNKVKQLEKERGI